MEMKPVPFTAGFMASSDGKVFSPEGEVRNTYTNGDGYETVSVFTDEGKWVTFGIHRLVAMAFHGMPANDEMQVNHRDMDVCNNVPENLEWVTPVLNNIHSELFNRDQTRPLLHAVSECGDEALFNNVWDCSKALGLEVLDIWDAIKLNTSVDGWKFGYLRFDSRIPTSFHKGRILSRDSKGRQPAQVIRMLDLDTNEVKVYQSLADAASAHETCASHIYQAIANGQKPKLFRKRYVVVKGETDFPIYDPLELSRARIAGKRDVIAYSFADEKFYLFSSARDFLDVSKLSKKTVTANLAKDNIKRTGDWVFLYLNDENKSRIEEVVMGNGSVERYVESGPRDRGRTESVGSPRVHAGFEIPAQRGEKPFHAKNSGCDHC